MPPLLSNSAVEFTETRAGPFFLERTPTQRDMEGKRPQFVRELDCFICAGEEVPNIEDYYKPSNEQMHELKSKLEQLIAQLARKGTFGRPGIKLKALQDWDMAYMLELTGSLLDDHHTASDNVQTCRDFIRNCTQAAVKKKTVLASLLSTVPTYGPVIGQCVTLVLTIVEEHQTLRKRMQASLADIPKRLSIIQRLSDLYVESPKLHACKNTVFFRIFMVLHCILDRLSRSLRVKMLQKVNGREPDVQGALEEMSTAIKDYRAEAGFCAQLRIGRTEEGVKELNYKIGSLAKGVNGIEDRVGGMEKAIVKAAEIIEEEKRRKDGTRSEEEMKTMAQNLLYYLFASDPKFNTKNGTIVRRETQNFLLAGRTKSLTPKNIPIVNSWLEGFQNFDLTSHREIVDHLFQMGPFDSDEQDRMHYIINSDSIVDWLNSVESGVLDITAETAPDNLFNPISASSAMLAFLLECNKAWAVLSFFSSLKPTDEYHGPVALVNCLNGQLLRFMVREKLEVDLSFLKKKKYGKRTRDELVPAMDLLGKLLSMLPVGQVVFIILDSLSRLSGDGQQVKAIIKMLDKEARINSNLILKVLVTDPLQNCLAERLSTLSLHVPDEVDKWQCGIPRSILEQEAATLVARFQRRHNQFNTNSSGCEEESEEESNESEASE